MNEWISVKDGLPEDDETLHFHRESNMEFVSVLVCGYYQDGKSPHVQIVNRLLIKPTGIEYIDNSASILNTWHWSIGFERITHWQPLPAPPHEPTENEKEM